MFVYSALHQAWGGMTLADLTAGKMNGSALEAIRMSRITSYNVCYTKLLRLGRNRQVAGLGHRIARLRARVLQHERNNFV